MRIYKEIELRDFEAWSGAVDTMETLKQLEDVTGENIFHTLEACLDDMGEGMSETEINDFFWFEDETIADWLGYGSWEELERVANEEEEEEIELEYNIGDRIMLTWGVSADIEDIDESDAIMPYCVHYIDKNGEDVVMWIEPDMISE